MPKCFVIEDESHSEWIGRFDSLGEAWTEVERRAAILWDQEPNVAPCASWRTCGRTYEIIEFETSNSPWQELQRFSVLNVSATGVVWLTEVPGIGA